MPLTVERYPTPGAFLERAQPMLLRREAENNLILGVVGQLVQRPERQAEPPYLATVSQRGIVVAAVMRTPPFGVALTQMPPEAIDSVARDIADAYKWIPGVLAPRNTAEAFAHAWSRHAASEAAIRMQQRIYQLHRVTFPTCAPSGTLRQAREGDIDLLTLWILAFNGDTGAVSHRQPRNQATQWIENGAAFLWEDSQPVSMAAWTGRTPNGVRISGVYTPKEQRRRGYASVCVAHLSQRMLDEGRAFCFLFTDLGNPTSNSIYQAIGYEPVCDVSFYEFRAAGSQLKTGG
jgi:predicted GNAT family acetyltransferase